MGPRDDIIDFYSHRPKKMGTLAVFSNFYDQSDCPFDFHVPLAYCACEITDQERIVSCDFFEKAIMLCKAAECGDIDTYRFIAKAKQPAEAKRLASLKRPL